MFCTSPITIYKRGDQAVINPATGLPERMEVACGHCWTCRAGRKNDWAGRLIAEAKGAKAVYFVTLTYSREPEDYQYRDVQLMLKDLRVTLARYGGGASVRFFCVGERGNKFGRIHWHLMLFADRDLRCFAGHPEADLWNKGFSNWNKFTQAKKLWPWWQHGWAEIVRVPHDDIVRRVRYCAKYAVKEVGSDKSCRLRCSLKPAIGGAYLMQWAEDLAQAGLPMKGFYTLPGLLWEKGQRAGQHVRYRMKGSTARKAAERYCDVWTEKRRSKPWPVTPFLQTYYPAQMMDRLLLWPETKGPALGKLPEGQAGKLVVIPKDVDKLNMYKVFWGLISEEEIETQREERREAERNKYPTEEEHEQWRSAAFERRRESERYQRRKECASADCDLSHPVYVSYIETGGFPWTPENLAEVRSNGAFLKQGW